MRLQPVPPKLMSGRASSPCTSLLPFFSSSVSQIALPSRKPSWITQCSWSVQYSLLASRSPLQVAWKDTDNICEDTLRRYLPYTLTLVVNLFIIWHSMCMISSSSSGLPIPDGLSPLSGSSASYNVYPPTTSLVYFFAFKACVEG